MILAATQHRLDGIEVLDGFCTGRLEVTLPPLALVDEVFVLIFDALRHQSYLALVILQTRLKIANVRLVDVDALK